MTHPPHNPEPASTNIEPQMAAVDRRNYYRVTSHATPTGREHHTVTAPRRGPNRERARQAILSLLRRAQARQHRVAFTVSFSDHSRLRLGSKGGYDPARALLGCSTEQNDPYRWLHEQLLTQRPRSGSGSMISVSLT